MVGYRAEVFVMAFDPVGIGEFWTGIVLGVVAIPCAVVLWWTLEGWWSGHRYTDGVADPLDAGPIDRGTLLCDLVDEETLRSVAAQQGISVAPSRIEEDTRRASGISARLRSIGGEHRREAGRREIREPIDDMNVLVRRVLKELDEKASLNRHLDRVPGIEVFEGSITLGDAQESTEVLTPGFPSSFREGSTFPSGSLLAASQTPSQRSSRSGALWTRSGKSFGKLPPSRPSRWLRVTGSRQRTSSSRCDLSSSTCAPRRMTS